MSVGALARLARRGPPLFQRSGLDKAVGDKIAAERVTRAMTRRELAASAEIDYWALGRIERGQQAPYPSTLRRIAAALEVVIDDLAPGWTKDEMERIKSGAVHPGIGLRVLRQRIGVSLAEAAAAAKVDPSTHSRLDRGLHGERDLFRAVLDGPLTITSEPPRSFSASLPRANSPKRAKRYARTTDTGTSYELPPDTTRLT